MYNPRALAMSSTINSEGAAMRPRRLLAILVVVLVLALINMRFPTHVLAANTYQVLHRFAAADGSSPAPARASHSIVLGISTVPPPKAEILIATRRSLWDCV
jgi:hypothetical protein